MSLFGKILAVLNIFGAVAVVFLAIMDYTKRQAWAYSVFRHELVVTGLPVDDTELDAQGLPLVNKIGEQTTSDLFGKLGGNPVSTQVEEVERVQQSLKEKFDAKGISKRQQAHVLARILFHLAETYIDREQLLSCKVHLASDDSLADLRKRYQTAFDEAKVPREGQTVFPDVFRLAVRRQAGEPSERFTTLVLGQLPVDFDKARNADINKAFDEALERQRVQLLVQFQSYFADALQKPLDNTQPDKLSRAGQKNAIAGLLYNLALFQAEDQIQSDKSNPGRKDLEGLDPGSFPYLEKLIATEAYKTLLQRAQTVVGLRELLDAVGRQAVIVQSLANQVNLLIDEDRNQFAAAHDLVVKRVQEASDVLRDEEDRLKDARLKLDEIKDLVDKRKAEIKLYEEDLADAQKVSAAQAAQVRLLSEKLLGVRLKVRDALRKNQEGEKRIRELEAKVRQVERKTKK